MSSWCPCSSGQRGICPPTTLNAIHDDPYLRGTMWLVNPAIVVKNWNRSMLWRRRIRRRDLSRNTGPVAAKVWSHVCLCPGGRLLDMNPTLDRIVHPIVHGLSAAKHVSSSHKGPPSASGKHERCTPRFPSTKLADGNTPDENRSPRRRGSLQRRRPRDHHPKQLRSDEMQNIPSLRRRFLAKQ